MSKTFKNESGAEAPFLLIRPGEESADAIERLKEQGWTIDSWENDTEDEKRILPK